MQCMGGRVGVVTPSALGWEWPSITVVFPSLSWLCCGSILIGVVGDQVCEVLSNMCELDWQLGGSGEQLLQIRHPRARSCGCLAVMICFSEWNFGC